MKNYLLDDRGWGYLTYSLGPFYWVKELRIIYSAQGSVVRLLGPEDDGDEAVRQWNLKYAEWLMVKP